MPESLNQQIADALTARQLQDGRAETAQRRALWRQLAVLEAELLAALKGIDPSQFVLLRRRQRAVEEFMDDEGAPLITTRYQRMADDTTTFLDILAWQEAQAVRRLLNAIAEEEKRDPLMADLPEREQLTAAVVAGRIPTPTRPTDLSATGVEWWERQATGLIQRVRDSLLVSVALHEPLTQMVDRIRGTSEVGFKDGIMQRAQDDAARLLRTQVTNAVSEARMAVAASNATQTVVMHQSILDSRTSQVCLGRHGLRYTAATHAPIGHDIPYLTGPPYHPSCRSTMIPIARAGGPVAREDAAAWLRRRDAAYQDAVLGPTRAKMFRSGRLTSLSDLLDALTGRPLTLEALGA